MIIKLKDYLKFMRVKNEKFDRLSEWEKDVVISELWRIMKYHFYKSIDVELEKAIRKCYPNKRFLFNNWWKWKK